MFLEAQTADEFQELAPTLYLSGQKHAAAAPRPASHPDPFVKEQQIANPRGLLGLRVACSVPVFSGQQIIWVHQCVGVPEDERGW